MALPVARMTSGEQDQFRRIFAMSSALPPDQRASIRTLRPSAQPNCGNPCRNAAMRVLFSGSSAVMT